MTDQSFQSYLSALLDVNEPEALTPDVGLLKSGAGTATKAHVRAGLVQKAVLVEGQGNETPGEKALCLVRLALVDNDDPSLVLASHPEPFPVPLDSPDEDDDEVPPEVREGYPAPPPRALALALPTMARGETALIRARPSVGIVEGCLLPFDVLPSADRKATVTFRVELLQWYEAGEFSALYHEAPRSEPAYKRVAQEGTSWETAQAPSTVLARVRLLRADPQGSLEGGEELWRGRGEASGEPSSAGEGEVGQIALPLSDHSLPNALSTFAQSLYDGCRGFLRFPTHWMRPLDSTLPQLEGLGAAVERAEGSGARYLVLELEVVRILQVRDVTGDGRVLKQRLRKGQGEFPMDSPLHDCPVTLRFRTWETPRGASAASGDGFEIAEDPASPWLVRLPASTPLLRDSEEPFECWLGDTALPDDLDAAVRVMVQGEGALVLCPSPSQADTWRFHEVHLVAFERPPMTQQAPISEHLTYAEKLKEIGNRLYKEKKLEAAKSKYQLTLRIAESRALEDELDSEGDALRVLALRTSTFLNMAAVEQALGSFQEAIRWCNKCLELDEGSAKALYRRSQAHAGLSDFAAARTDLAKCKELDATAAGDVAAALARLKAQEEKGEAQLRKAFKGKL